MRSAIARSAIAAIERTFHDPSEDPVEKSRRNTFGATAMKINRTASMAQRDVVARAQRKQIAPKIG